jgi:hypothetical protein
VPVVAPNTCWFLGNNVIGAAMNKMIKVTVLFSYSLVHDHKLRVLECCAMHCNPSLNINIIAS